MILLLGISEILVPFKYKFGKVRWQHNVAKVRIIWHFAVTCIFGALYLFIFINIYASSLLCWWITQIWHSLNSPRAGSFWRSTCCFFESFNSLLIDWSLQLIVALAAKLMTHDLLMIMPDYWPKTKLSWLICNNSPPKSCVPVWIWSWPSQSLRLASGIWLARVPSFQCQRIGHLCWWNQHEHYHPPRRFWAKI
jgi:hypothetical protein